MTITKIEAFHLCIPLEKPYVLSKKYGTVTDAHAVLVKLSNDDGLVGYGEANPMPPFTSESWGSVFATIEHHLAPMLLGADPRQITRCNAGFDQTLSGNLLAKGALDVALYDLKGKVHGVPVHQLLGGSLREEIPLLWPFGSGTPAEDVARIKEKMDEGYRTFMIKMGALPIDTEIARVRAIEEAYGTAIGINVDANQGWTLAESLQFVQGVKDCHLDFIEQPVPRSQRWAYQSIRQRALHPLSADESVQTLEDAAALASEHAVDVFSLKISKNGGISRALAVANLGQAFGIRCLLNSMIELGVSQAALLQLGATLPNLMPGGHCFMSTLRLADDVTNFADFITDAVVRLPEGPGLGIEVDEDKLAKYTEAAITVS
jgi:L-alanine-DL-glutamate epimerase-like enolase superfamily enzyme